MPTTPSQLDFTQEVFTSVVGDTVTAPNAGSLILFPQNNLWYQKDSAGLVTAIAASVVGTAPVSASVAVLTIPGVVVTEVTGGAFSANIDYSHPACVQRTTTFDQVSVEVTTAGGGGSTGRFAVYNANTSYQPTTLVEEWSFSTASTGVRTFTPASGTRTLPPGRYLYSTNFSQGTSMRAFFGTVSGGAIILPTMGASPLNLYMSVARTHGAFPGTGVAWTSVSGNNKPGFYFAAFRVTAVS